MINYNEDYNYAYHSTDSLNHPYGDSAGLRRKGATLPMPPSPYATSAAAANQPVVGKVPAPYGYQPDTDGTATWNQRPNRHR